MNITLLGPAFPYRGGLASFNNRLARQFSDEGHNVKILTFRLQYPRLLFPGKTQFTDGPPPDGVDIKRVLNSVNPISWIVTGLKIRKEKPDILLLRYWIPFMGPCLGTVARIVRSNKHTVVISIFDNVIPHEKRIGDKVLTKYFVKSISGAVVMSKSVMDDLYIFRSNLPVKLNPHPLFDNYGKPISREEAILSLKLDPDNNYMLFFGFIRAYKGLDLLIEAMSDSRLRNKKLKLIVAGEFYEDESLYRKLVIKNDLEADILFYNYFVKDEEVPAFFGVAEIVVQPYKTATQSGVTQIAYHYEKPMLVTDVGGLREIVPDGKCGYVVKPQPKLIADAITDFFDSSRQYEFTEEVKKEKEKYSWNGMTSSIIEVFNDCRSK